MVYLVSQALAAKLDRKLAGLWCAACDRRKRSWAGNKLRVAPVRQFRFSSHP
jgi:hypothetical protein